jgi:hypothetical protein
MPEVTLRYDAPVYVEVDTDTGKVNSVIVSDEECEPAEGVGVAIAADSTVERKPYDIEGVDDATYEQAVKIADHAEWPAWKFGY